MAETINPQGKKPRVRHTEEGVSFEVTVQEVIGTVSAGDDFPSPIHAAMHVIADYAWERGRDATFQFPGPDENETVTVQMSR